MTTAGLIKPVAALETVITGRDRDGNAYIVHLQPGGAMPTKSQLDPFKTHHSAGRHYKPSRAALHYYRRNLAMGRE